MDTNQPTMQTSLPPAQPVYPVSNVFKSKVPSTVTFAVIVLLFFLPFVAIKCNNVVITQVTGFQLATGFEMKTQNGGNPLLNEFKTDQVDQGITKATTQTDKKDPNLYAMIALGLGVLGLLLSFTNAKAGLGVAMVTAIGSAGALIGLMIDVKQKAKVPDMGKGNNSLQEGLKSMGQQLDNSLNISVDFTPWFYIAIIASLLAAYFCYRRMQLVK